MRAYFFSLRILACLAIWFAVCSLSCRSKSPEEPEAEAGEPNTPAASDADNIAVTVNGVGITEGEIEKLIAPQLAKIAKQAAQLPPAFAVQYRKQLREQILERLVCAQLLEQKIKEANIAVTEEEVMSKVREIASSQKEPLSLEDFRKKIEEYGLSFEDVKEDVRRGLSHEKFMDMQWGGKINVTEDDAKKYYDENPKRFETPEQIRASHILIKPALADPNADPNEAKATAKAKIQELLKQIKDGADLAELAKANSDCPSAPDGGDVGFFPRGKTTPPFEKAAFELEVGQISDIVETEYGYHIIKVTDHQDAGVVSFEQAKEGIIKQLTEDKQREFANEYIESLKAKANIVYSALKNQGP